MVYDLVRSVGLWIWSKLSLDEFRSRMQKSKIFSKNLQKTQSVKFVSLSQYLFHFGYWIIKFLMLVKSLWDFVNVWVFQTKETSKDDFSDLPPQQRKRRIQQRLDALNQQMGQETLTRDALMKMKGVYEANPTMGDPNSVNGQLSENSVKLDALRQELSRLQVMWTFVLRQRDDEEGPTDFGCPLVEKKGHQKFKCDTRKPKETYRMLDIGSLPKRFL